MEHIKAQDKIQYKGDPSDEVQHFPKYNLQILCCRYWWLHKWEFKELSFPYWRIYHNQNRGASIIHENTEIKLEPNKLIMIAPNTSYATKLYDHSIPESHYSFIGGRISRSNLDEKATENSIRHLFIHFNIGMPFDNVPPGIFCYELTDHLLEKIVIIKEQLYIENQHFNFHTSLAIHSLVSDLLTMLPKESWNLKSHDARIQSVLRFIEENLNADLSNPVLAEKTNMATNSFTRLFVNEMGMAPQQYVQNKRIAQVSILLHHSNKTIEEIALDTGFYDRFHLTKMFKKWTGTSPARYKKQHSPKQA